MSTGNRIGRTSSLVTKASKPIYRSANSSRKRVTTLRCLTVGFSQHCLEVDLLMIQVLRCEVYNAFVTRGRKSAKWCSSHCLNFKALSRAVSIRLQLAKYMQRFAIPLTSCNGDHKTIRRCLVSGYFKNAAKFASDGTYTLLRSNAVRTYTSPVVYMQHSCLD